MLNTVTDIAGEEIAEVAAWLDDDGRPVDIRGVIIARLASGALVTMNGVRPRHPGIRLRRPRLLRARHAADWRLGRALRAAATRRPAPVAGPVRGVPNSLGAVPGGPQRPRTEPEPTRSRSADGPPVGRHPGIVGARRRGRPTRCAAHDRPRHRLERVPPGPDGRGVAGDLSGRDPWRDRGRPARARTASRSGPRPWTSRTTASATRCSPRPTS